MKSALKRNVVLPVEHRIAGLVSRGQQPTRPNRVEFIKVEPTAPASSGHNRLEIARQAIITRLAEEVSPERRAVLTRRDLAKIVNASVHAYCVRHALEISSIARRDFVTDIMQNLLALEQTSSAARQGAQLTAAQIAKAQLMPLIIEQMDIGAASEMPRAEFETQLTGWVKRLLVENKIQLNFAEQRAVIELLIDDMLGLGQEEHRARHLG